MTMKRSAYLRDLSSDHHQALRLSREILNRKSDPQHRQSIVNTICKEYRERLLPHFIIEEFTIVPALTVLGERQLAAQVLDEHRLLNELVQELDDDEALSEFAELLRAHVRFEEKSVFDVCQRLLS